MKLFIIMSLLMLSGCDLYYKSTTTSGGDFSSTNSVSGNSEDNSDNSDNSDNRTDNSTINGDGNTKGDNSPSDPE